MTETPKDETGNGETRKRFGKGSNFVGKPGRSGPAQGNVNGLKHGLKSQRFGMVGGKLPAGLAYIEKRVNILRRQVEAAILELRGVISITDAAAVNSILKWERHGLLASNWLRKEADKLSASDRLRFSEAIAKASDNRDRNIRLLQLDVKPDPWGLLYLEQTPAEDDSPSNLLDK